MKRPTLLLIIGIPIQIAMAVFFAYTDPNGLNNFYTGFSTSGALAFCFFAVYSELLLGSFDRVEEESESA